MKAVLRTAVTLALIPFGVGLCVELAKPLLPDALPTVLRWLAMLVEWAGFPWVFAGGLGLLVGMWLDRWAGAFDGRHPITRRGKAKALADEVEFIGNSIRNVTDGLRPDAANHGVVATGALIVVQKLHRLGVRFPNSGGAVNGGLAFLGHQLRCIAPALREGDVDLAARIITETVRQGTALPASGVGHDE